MTDAEITKKLIEIMDAKHCQQYFWLFPSGEVIHKSKWKPLSNISDAWMVVERMREKGWDAFFLRYLDGWRSSFIHKEVHGNEKIHYGKDNNSPCRAICLASLAAKEGNDG